MKRLSLRPYNGSLYVCKTLKSYQKANVEVFGERDIAMDKPTGSEGRFVGGCGADGKWAYVIWYTSPHTLAHELSHVVLEVFLRCGIDPREAGGEPFCYMLSQLMLEATE